MGPVIHRLSGAMARRLKPSLRQYRRSVGAGEYQDLGSCRSLQNPFRCSLFGGLFDRFDRRRHAAFAALDVLISAEGMNLISLQLGMFQSRGQQNRTSRGVDFFGDLVADLNRFAKQLAQHHDHVFVAVIGIVPEDDVVTRLGLGAALALFFLLGLLLRLVNDHLFQGGLLF